MASWNEIKADVEKSDNAVLKETVEILEAWMEYAREDERYMEIDMREDMKHDIGIYRQRVGELVETIKGTGGGKF